ncbi:peptidylprolyl cis-trans isomerase, cyclophilin-type domain containing protein [Acanthamoeba castellanii str. Neff]|uniref:Peptidyl-prolyl cis-trans isomerase n=1 Tax=Acanthamoeba castellanii (strain ATCC 30010 / Neff) TaxID=1257118 RepID=L8H0V6_ACACF|nr:peptidylprolyl cis-trans isomerase, cyclophilin-type domain containing protein [Acanthamoeba castellanii str. Neff]ELR19094.1 peptidylprolyl cis-trans isomerase, cyclophilin-type domain containing protein [Acanthamoeba castellanii str. Neff]
MQRAFVDVDIGSAQQHAVEVEEYQRAAQFLAAVGAQYGLPTNLQELDEGQRETLAELYAADPSWTANGPMRAAAPTPLRAGRIVIELYADKAPKAVENFLALCTGEKGISKASKKPLHFKGSRFHRIVKDFVCQGGDFTRGDGSGGESIYGRKFKDEKDGLKLLHKAVGTLSMANSGKDSNSSQFFFTLADNLTKLNGKHVVFGQVVEGVDILHRINREAASADGSPKVDVVIADCGQC